MGDRRVTDRHGHSSNVRADGMGLDAEGTRNEGRGEGKKNRGRKVAQRSNPFDRKQHGGKTTSRMGTEWLIRGWKQGVLLV